MTIVGYRPPAATGLIPFPGTRAIKWERRTWVWTQAVPDRSSIVVKLYRRRRRGDFGLRPPLRYRAQREFETLRRLTRHGVPCSEPLFWTAGLSTAHGRHEVLATREVPRATDLRTLLRNGADPARDLDLAPLFRAIREMHACGVFHGALNAGNVLIAGRGCYLIDFPRSLRFPRSIVGTRAAAEDLLSLCDNIRRWSSPQPRKLPLAAYGWDARECGAFAETFDRYRRTKGRRYRARLIILLDYARQRLMCAVARSRPGPLPTRFPEAG